MILKTVLYLVYFLKLSEERLLNAEMPDIYNLAANVLQGVPTARPDSSNFYESTFTSSLLPEIAIASKSVQKFKKHNAYKNQKGYTFSEVLHNGVKDGGSTSNKNTAEVIPESRFLYHSFENPLFKSNSLNLQPDDDDNELPIISDVHKISSPFESKWIFFPTNKGISGKGLGSSAFDFLKKTRGIRNPSEDSSSSLTALPFKSTSNNSIFGDLKQDPKLFSSLSGSAIAPATAIDSTSTEKSFYGYNLEEVKTADGKTRGVMQIYDKDGLKRNVIYDEKGTVIDHSAEKNKLENVTKQANVRNNTVSLKTQNNNTTANGNVIAAQKSSNNSVAVQSTTSIPTYINYQLGNFSNHALPSEEVEYNQPAVNSFATPEYILFNFLGQLNSMPFIPSNENFVTNELSSFDESVDENSFFFVEK